MTQAILLGGGAKMRHIDVELFDNPDVEVWDINFIHAHREWPVHIDRMFHIHRYELLKKYGYPTSNDAIWARSNPKTRIILADRWPDKRMNRAEIFPRKEIAEAFPNPDYHCNSADWLIAYALYEGIDVVHLHGWNLEREGMIEQQSAPKCLEYWIGFAMGKGMEVMIGEDSAVFGVYHPVKSNRVYGYDDCPAWEDKTVNGKDPPYRYDEY